MNLYLDNAATTQVNKKVVEKVNQFFTEKYANPSSTHKPGRDAREEIENARKKIAHSINAEPEEIIFTSGGTESNNLAIKGLAESNPDKKHIITSQIEHHCILETCKYLEKKGYKIDYIPVDEKGIINPEIIKQKITSKTLLVSIMHVNNEIGTIQPIEEIAKICKSKNCIFHTDAVQSYSKIKIDVKKQNIDMLSVSGHKINAPKGIGFLYVKKGIKLTPLLHGGGQEFRKRSGTENTPGIIGLATALDIKRNKEEIEKIRNYIIKEIEKIPEAKLNGDKKKRIYHNINFSFYGIEGESLVLMLENAGIYVSTGSACSSHKLEESHVLKAINNSEFYIHGSIRITLNQITKKQADYLIKNIKESVQKLIQMTPFKLNKTFASPVAN